MYVNKCSKEKSVKNIETFSRFKQDGNVSSFGLLSDLFTSIEMRYKYQNFPTFLKKYEESPLFASQPRMDVSR